MGKSDPRMGRSRHVPVVLEDVHIAGWMHEPREREYRAAHSFLSLLLTDEAAEATVEALRRAPVVPREAKDILRASGLDAVPPDNPKVAKKIRRIRASQPLAPVLLVRGRLHDGAHLTIADGFHRICAAITCAPGARVPAKLVDLPPPADRPAQTAHGRRTNVGGAFGPARAPATVSPDGDIGRDDGGVPDGRHG